MARPLVIVDADTLAGWRRPSASLAQLRAALADLRAQAPDVPLAVIADPSLKWALPPDEQEGVVVLTGSYGEAGAVDRFGAAHGLPPAFSPHNGYADFRRPTDDSATVVAVRYGAADGYLSEFFDACTEVDRVDNGLDVEIESQGTPILVCRGLRGTWPEVWEELRFLA